MAEEDYGPRKRSSHAGLYFIVTVGLLAGGYHYAPRIQASLDRLWAPRAGPALRLLTGKPAPGTGPALSAAPAPGRRPPEKPKAWTIRVSAYRLLDLKAVPNLSLRLQGPEEGGVFKPRLNDGKFQFYVPSLEEGGYRLEVRISGKPARFIEDGADVPYRDHSPERRFDEARELGAQKVLHVPIRPSGDAAVLDYPIVVLP